MDAKSIEVQIPKSSAWRLDSRFESLQWPRGGAGGG